MTTLTDSIERTLTLNAPLERVYDAIANPARFSEWFMPILEGDLNAGSKPLTDAGEYGTYRLAIVAADPHTYFAWRWVSGSSFAPNGFQDDPLRHPNTLVEFFLEPAGDGTLLRLVESGFASLPESYRSSNLSDNQGGWTYMLGRLDKFIETGRPE